MLKNAPGDLVEGALKIKWNDAEHAQAVVGDGEVVVFMRRSKHKEDNVANALMAYLPRALIPRARRYVDPETMRAVDLTVAKGVLHVATETPGAIHAFFEQHLDPACSDDDMRKRVVEIDEIDLHGWLARVLLPEYRYVGNELYPGEPTAAVRQDAEAFARWLHGLAAREPGDETVSLAYAGRFFRVAVVLVANKYKLAEQGVEPYRKKAKRLVYSGDYDAVYLMGRDDNIPAVREVVKQLKEDGRVSDSYLHEFRLRSDFKKRKLWRERGVIACLRPRHAGAGAIAPDEDLQEGDVVVFDPSGEIQAGRVSDAPAPSDAPR